MFTLNKKGVLKNSISTSGEPYNRLPEFGHLSCQPLSNPDPRNPIESLDIPTYLYELNHVTYFVSNIDSLVFSYSKLNKNKKGMKRIF